MAQGLSEELAHAIKKAGRFPNGEVVQWNAHGTKRTRGLCAYLQKTGQWQLISDLEAISRSLKFELGDLEIATHSVDGPMLGHRKPFQEQRFRTGRRIAISKLPNSNWKLAGFEVLSRDGCHRSQKDAEHACSMAQDPKAILRKKNFSGVGFRVQGILYVGAVGPRFGRVGVWGLRPVPNRSVKPCPARHNYAVPTELSELMKTQRKRKFGKGTGTLRSSFSNVDFGSMMMDSEGDGSLEELSENGDTNDTSGANYSGNPKSTHRFCFENC